ncbi:MAG: D-aminoacylase [Dissulfurispiraceae bacterium]|jgi:N-acyl-D-amino-acid deacylase|nr:D-aminoacylase [Dissulfurispiraceae bacterium]
MDILLKGGHILDGTGTPAFDANVGVVGDMISYIGSGEPEADNVLDITGLCLCPGFIDAHAHSEFTLMADGRAEAKIAQGVTTEINGNCGLSAAPLSGQAAVRREADMLEYGITERWSSFGEYFSLLSQKGIGINFATLCGHGNLRGSVFGYADGMPDPEQMSAMRQLAQSSVKEGIAGLSTGLIYPPGIFSDTDEIAELCRIFADMDGVYASHMRSEGEMLLESLQEMIDIAYISGIRIHVSHLKTYGMENWHKADAAIDMLRKGIDSGLRITCDRYPYTAAGTDLDAILPGWAHEGGIEEEMRRLQSPQSRSKIEEELRQRAQDIGGAYWQGIVISSVSRPESAWMEGWSISDISSKLGIRPEEAVVDIVISEHARASAHFFVMCEENLRKFLSLPFAMIGSDSSARSFSGPTCIGRPHPRAFGSFPRFLGRYARDENMFSLEEAVRKITGLPAETFRLTRRGAVREGFYADLTVFEYSTISDRSTYNDPYVRPEGIAHVFVNGKSALSHGSLTGMLGGRIIKTGNI